MSRLHRSTSVPAILVVIVVVASCARPAGDLVAQGLPGAPSPEPSEPLFTYSGANGPEAWGDLSPEYTACADGSAQSPIDLADADEVDLADIVFDYRAGDVELVDTGHTIQANEPPGSAIVVDGERYALAQFHFHEPSEHTVAGERFAGELHLVHRDDRGRLAVVAVLLREGAASAALAPVFAALPAELDATAQVEGFDPSDVLPEQRTTYRYDGSLTTPPCTEGVSWFVLDTPIEVSAAQLAAFSGIIEANNRPLQARGDRDIAHDTSRG
jgi:carbonic anhydrase